MIVYTQYSDDGETVRMSLHPFTAPFGYSDAPPGFRFKHRVIAASDALGGLSAFGASCYNTIGVYTQWRKERRSGSYENWLNAVFCSEEEREAESFVEFEALQWLLEGEDD